MYVAFQNTSVKGTTTTHHCHTTQVSRIEVPQLHAAELQKQNHQMEAPSTHTIYILTQKKKKKNLITRQHRQKRSWLKSTLD